jgi:hypothetical protein
MRTASLSSYGLTPGNYLVSVQAIDTLDSSNTSSSASKAIVLATGDFSQVRVYPNPWKSNLHSGQNLIFDGLPPKSSVKVFTVSGHLVRDVPLTLDSTKASWDLRNESGDLVGSGIYLYLIKTSTEKMTGKIVVVK